MGTPATAAPSVTFSTPDGKTLQISAFPSLHVGDTVVICGVNDDDVVTMEFEDHGQGDAPLKKVDGSKHTYRATKQGNFVARCSLLVHGKPPKIGWSPSDPNAGVDFPIGPPR